MNKCFILLVGILMSGWITLLAAAPINDIPCNAIVIPVNGLTYVYDNIDATAELDEVSPPAGTNPDGSCVSRDGWCFSDLTPDKTVWFTFTAPPSGKVTISTCDAVTAFDNQVAVYTVSNCADYTTFTFVGGNDDAPAGCGISLNEAAILYLAGLIPGQTYYIQVDGYLSEEGIFGISITESFANANDDVCNAQSITLSGTPICSDNFFASAQHGEPAGINWVNNDGVQNSVWYKFIAPTSGKAYFSTSHANTTFDTQIAVYASSDNTCQGVLTEVTSDDDSGSIGFVTSETFALCLRPGNTYFVQIDGFGGAFGEFCLVVNDTAASTGLTASIVAPIDQVCEGSSFTVISSAIGGTPGLGNTFTGTNPNPFPIPDANPTGVSSTITLNGSSGIVTPTGQINVNLTITHTYVSDLYIYLIGPGNCGAMELSTGNGGSGDNYTNTVFSTAASNIIGTPGNNTAPFTGTYRPEGTISSPPAPNTFSIPTTPLNGCPISGTWTLRVIDAVSGDIGTVQNWSLSIAESYYQHQIIGPGNIQIAVSGSNNSTATATVTNAPPGNHAYITYITDATGCIQTDTVFVKVFDIPDIDGVATTCVTNNDGTIRILATLDNANFIGNDVATLEYSFDGGNTWTNTNTSAGYSIGTYYIGIRNSVLPSCQRFGYVTLQTAPVLNINHNSPVCEGSTVQINAVATGGNQFTNNGNASPNISIPDNNTTGVRSSIPIIGIGIIDPTSIIAVTLNITHPWVGDVHVYLVGPNNCGTLELTTGNGGSGDNYVNTVLNTAASLPITSGTPPFTGTFLPEGTITGTNTNTLGLPTNGIAGCPVNGDWTLRVFDLAAGDTGTLNNWSLAITRTGNLQHQISGNGTIGPINYSGINNANGSVSITGVPIGVNQFIYTITALSGCTVSDTFHVDVFDIPNIQSLFTECSSGANGEILVVTDPLNNANFSGNNIGVIEYSYDGGITWTTANPSTGLTPDTYNIYVRNSANPSCQSGPESVDVLFVSAVDAGNDVTICSGSSTTLTASGGVTYWWSTGDTSSSITVSPSITTTYSVTATAANGCSSTDEVTVFVQSSLDPALGPDFDLCEGSVAILTAHAGDTFLWSTNETTASITVSPTETTTYSVTVSDVNGCIGTDTITITIISSINPNLPSSVNLCSGSSTTLTASGGGSYLWNTGATSASITVSPTTNTIYSVTVTNSGCSGSGSTLVVVQPLPDPNLPGSVTLCSGSSTTLTASGGDFYLWNTGATSASITVSPTTNTIYSVTVSSGICNNSATTNVIVNPIPLLNLPDLQICSGASLILDAGNPGASYLWSTNASTQTIIVSTPGIYSVTVTMNSCTSVDTAVITTGGSLNISLPAYVEFCSGSFVELDAGNPGASYNWSDGSTTQSITISSGGTIYVTVTDQNGCIGTDTTVVNELPLPEADAGLPQSICSEEVAVLSASGGISYEWSNGTQGAINIVVPSQTTTYRVTVTGAGGCQQVDSVTVTVLPAPQITVSNDTTVCAFSPLILTASGGETYLWNTNATGQSIQINPVQSAAYTVTVTDANNCTASASVYVTTLPLPNANAGSDVGICEGNTVTLFGSGNGNFIWSTGATTSTLTVSPTTTTQYQLTVVGANGCSHTDEVTVFVYPLPVVTLRIANQTICADDTLIDLIPSPPGGILSGNGVIGSSFSPSIAGSGVHILTYTYTDSNQCTASASLAVAVESCSGINEVWTNNQQVTIYPNPFLQELTIRTFANSENEIEYIITDPTGRILVHETMWLKAGENIFTWRAGDDIPAGIYMFLYKKQDMFSTFRLIRLQ